MPGFRNKYTAGNVCLLLFVAFLAMTAVGIMETGKAHAAPTYTYSYSGTDSSYSTTQLKPAIWIKPLTSATDWPSTFTYYINLLSAPGGDKLVAATVYGLPNPVLRSIYDTAYMNLLQLVYAPAASWNLQPGYTVAYQGVRETTAPNVIYVDLLYRPPDDNGGGGGGAVPPEQQTVPADMGTIVVVPSEGTATYEVDSTKALDALQSLGAGVNEFLLADLSKTDAAEKATIIGSNILQAGLDLAKDLVVNDGEVVITFPVGSVNPGTVAGAGAGAALRVSVKVMGDQVSITMVSGTQASGQGFVPQSNVFSLDASLVKGSQTVGDLSRFDNPVKVSFTYNAAAGVDENKLGVYGLDPVTKTWTYVGGKVDPNTNRITANLGHFSDYAVMLYDKTFADIATHWSKSDVELMASKHVVKGMTDTTFSPEAPVTRAQYAAMLLRGLALEESKPSTETFLDVSKDAWYFGAVETASKAGIVKGYDDGTFKPNAKVTREEMATMLVRALKLAKVNTAVASSDVDASLAKFSDKGKISSWAAEAAAYAAKSGILTGRTVTTFVPGGTGTRAEAAVMMKRFMVAAGQI